MTKKILCSIFDKYSLVVVVADIVKHILYFPIRLIVQAVKKFEQTSHWYHFSARNNIFVENYLLLCAILSAFAGSTALIMKDWQALLGLS